MAGDMILVVDFGGYRGPDDGANAPLRQRVLRNCPSQGGFAHPESHSVQGRSAGGRGRRRRIGRRGNSGGESARSGNGRRGPRPLPRPWGRRTPGLQAEKKTALLSLADLPASSGAWWNPTGI